MYKNFSLDLCLEWGEEYFLQGEKPSLRVVSVVVADRDVPGI